MSPGTARSWLFVPGDRSDRFDKAASSGADEVIIDLEDAVAPRNKASARQEAARWLGSSGSAWVRLNGASEPQFAGDVSALAQLPGLRGFMLPKAEEPEHMDVLAAAAPERPIVALIETPVGIAKAHEIATHPAVVQLAFGSLDFHLAIDAEESETTAFARATLVVASRAAGLPGPLDGVTPQVGDVAQILLEATRARQRGFAGKLCIHPTQVPPVHQAWAPSVFEIAWARSVVDATSGPGGTTEGAVMVEGAMIDRPVIRRARRILDHANQATAQSQEQ